MTDHELFNLIRYGDINDSAVVRKLATDKISRTMAERVIRRVNAAIRADLERAALNCE